MNQLHVHYSYPPLSLWHHLMMDALHCCKLEVKERTKQPIEQPFNDIHENTGD